MATIIYVGLVTAISPVFLVSVKFLQDVFCLTCEFFYFAGGLPVELVEVEASRENSAVTGETQMTREDTGPVLKILTKPTHRKRLV
jgi:hypothetical protein